MATSKFGERTTALEVVEGIDLKGKEAIVTGAASGLGVETARALAYAGARVVIAARDVAKAEAVAKSIRDESGGKRVEVEVEKIELDSLASVEAFVKRFLAKHRPLHILVNNAGIMACPKSYTEDGFEAQFGTNHMGHFALTIGLLPALKEAYRQSGKYSRVVNVSSIGHARANVNFDDINFKIRDYEPWVGYGQSKTANVLFSVALTHFYSHDGIVSNALMPGGIMTGLQKHVPKEEQVSRSWIDEHGNPSSRMKTTEQGASTTVWAAVAPELEGVGGKYLEDCAIAQATTPDKAFVNFKGYLPYAVDKDSAIRLWNISMEWLKNPPKAK